MDDFCFGQGIRKLPEKEGKLLFYKTYFEETFVLGKVYENYAKKKEKCYFIKLTSKRVISSGKHLFGPIIR